MRKRQITIKEIAGRLSISKSTVSRALRNAEDISPETKQRVLEMVRKLDYQPNRSALNLLQGKTFNIGVIVPSLTIPFYAEALSSMQSEAFSKGFNLLICQSNETQALEKRNLNALIQSGVDGIALSLSRETENCDHILRIKEKGIPVVLFNRINKCLGVSTIKVNDFKGSFDATEYLIRSGRRKIAYIQGPRNLLLSNERKSGYKMALEKAGLPMYREGKIPVSDFTIESGELIVSRLIEEKPRELPDAIYCICDAVAIGAIKAITAAGLRVPEDMAVMGFTNEPISAYCKPPLTTVSQPIHEIGSRASAILIDEIQKRIWSADQYQHIELEPGLIIRESA